RSSRGPAASPQGPARGGAARPPSASCRPVGLGCASSHSRTSPRRGSFSPGNSTSTAASLESGSMPGGWNFADVWELVADELPDAPALVHGDSRRTWTELDRRADGVARTLLDAGAQRQDKVAQYL